MKIIMFTLVVLFCVAEGVSAQTKGVSTAFKEIKKPPVDWPLLSFSKDSVYGMEVERAYEFLKDKPKKRKVIIFICPVLML